MTIKDEKINKMTIKEKIIKDEKIIRQKYPLSEGYFCNSLEIINDTPSIYFLQNDKQIGKSTIVSVKEEEAVLLGTQKIEKIRPSREEGNRVRLLDVEGNIQGYYEISYKENKIITPTAKYIVYEDYNPSYPKEIEEYIILYNINNVDNYIINVFKVLEEMNVY